MPSIDRENIHSVSQGKSAPIRNSRFGGPPSSASQDSVSVAKGAQAQLIAAMDSISDGFALFDADDRMIFCNRRFKEQNPVLALCNLSGMSFEEMLRKNIGTGQIFDAFGNEEAYIRARLEQHRNPSGPLVQQRVDGRWLELREERTSDGAP
jgi:PAS domain-containing protein